MRGYFELLRPRGCLGFTCSAHVHLTFTSRSAPVQIVVALGIIMLFADPFVSSLERLATSTNIPSFLVACFIPIVSNMR